VKQQFVEQIKSHAGSFKQQVGNNDNSAPALPPDVRKVYDLPGKAMFSGRGYAPIV